jgi:hypothetical protein
MVEFITFDASMRTLCGARVEVLIDKKCVNIVLIEVANHRREAELLCSAMRWARTSAARFTADVD